ncbi:hypothetical protein MKW98_013438 [Papaver atlanticum]|uniref:SAM domain-containing protein n=1 Tax=Papaver atlanticum TaxID=357466 RepID=A0AAD4STV7_9MAGN|nr:hypothetical protein MKW98_013438 [Papaver atlanticum]
MKLKELENGYRDWVSKQSFPVKDAVYIASNAIHGAAQGALLGTLSQVAASHVFPQHSLAIKAIGIFAGLSCIIKRIREKDDVQTRMAAGFFLWSHPPSVEYTRTRCMLSTFGLENYEKNFKKGLLTDITLPLLTDSVLKDVGVPPGPRLLILDHIEKDSGIPNCERCTQQGRAA